MATDWLSAAKDGDLASLRRLHASSAEPDALLASHQPGVSSVGHSALHWASSGGHAECARWLLGTAAEAARAHLVALVNNGGSTPLHSACANGRAPLVTLLMEHGARSCLAVTDCNGDTPLAVAASHGHEEAAAALVRACQVGAAGSTAPTPPHAFLGLSIGGRPVGDLILRLDDARAPRACANFLGLCMGLGGAGGGGAGYRGTHFHRLLPKQMIQGGRVTARGRPASIFGGQFDDEQQALAVPQARAATRSRQTTRPRCNRLCHHRVAPPTPAPPRHRRACPL